MNHLLLFFYILTISISCAGLAAMAILHIRIKRPETGTVLVVSSALVASLFLTLVRFYLVAILGRPPQAAPFTNVIGVALALLVYGGVVRLLMVAGPAQRLLSIVATGLVVAVQLARTAIYVLMPLSVTEAIHLPALAMISAYLLYVGVMLFRSGRSGDHGTVNALVRRIGLLLIIFAPVSTAVYSVIDFIPAAVRPYLSLDFLFMVALAGIALSVFVRYLALPSTLLDEGALSAAFIREFSITPREAEVIGLVGRGLSNKEIAGTMHVSAMTIRTHLYNVFQKTGAGSRVDLLRIASGYRE